MRYDYTAVQRAWLYNMDQWLRQVGQVSPEFARAAVPALQEQAKALAIDPADIHDPAWDGQDQPQPPLPTQPTPPQQTQPANPDGGDQPGTPHDRPIQQHPSGGPDPQFGGSTPQGPLSVEDRVKFSRDLADHLKSKYGLNDQQVAGVMGNLMLESRMNPNVREGMSYGGGPDPVRGMGIAQWTGMPGRGGDFAEFSRQHGLDLNSEAANVAFLDHELEGEFSNVIDDLKRTSSTHDAALVWEREFEKATSPNNESRFRMADNFLKFLNGDDSAIISDLEGA